MLKTHLLNVINTFIECYQCISFDQLTKQIKGDNMNLEVLYLDATVPNPWSDKIRDTIIEGNQMLYDVSCMLHPPTS